MQILRDIQAVINDVDDADIHCQWFNLVNELFICHEQDALLGGKDLMAEINHWIENNAFSPFWYAGDYHSYREAMA